MKKSLLLAGLLSSAANLTYAQDTSEDTIILDEVIVSNTRTETPVDDATVSVDVLSADEISEKTTVNTNVGQILSQTLPGFSQSNGSLSDLGLQLRGRNFQTLIDGVPQTNLSFSTSRALNAINPAALEQIEVVKGATAAYGFGAPGGLINLITKRATEDYSKTEITTGITFQPTDVSESVGYNTSISTSGRRDNIDYVFGGSFEKTGASFDADGNRRSPDVLGRQGGVDDAQSYNLLGKLGVEFDNGRIDLMANHFDYQQDSEWMGTRTGGSITNNTSALPTRGQPGTEQPGSVNTTLSAKYTHYNIFGGAAEIQAYYNHSDVMFSAVDFFGVTYPELQNEATKYGARLTFDTPLNDVTNVVWGLDYINESAEITDFGLDTIPDYDVSGIAPFAQFTADLGDRATVTAGLRYENLDVKIPTHINESGVSVTGGSVSFNKPLFNVSGSYDVSTNATIFAGFSQGFELGSLGRYLYNSDFTDVSQLSTKGQTTDSFELGIRGDNGAFDYSAVVFYSQNDNGSTYDSNLDLVLAKEEIKGLELAASYQISEQIKIGGSYTLMEGRYDADGNGSLETDLGSDRIAPQKITTFAAYAPNEDSSYRLDVLYSGTRDPDSNEFTGLETIQSYVLVDLSAKYKVGKGTLSIGVSNLLDEDYVPVVAQSYSAQAFGYDDYYYTKGAGRTASVAYHIAF